MAIRRPNLMDQIVGLAGTDETGDVGQTRIIGRTGQEFVQTPTAPAQATGRFYNEVRGVMDTMPTTPPTSLNAALQTTSTPAPVATPTTGGGYTSTVVPEARTISTAEADALAREQFLSRFGDDPDWQAKLAEYEGDVDAAYEAILGEEGPLAEGRRLAEDTFRRQTEQARTGFRQSRQQLAEQAFLGERQMQQQLASRGLGGAGLAQLGGVQQQLAQGRQATGLFNEFTRSLENIAAAEAKSAQQFSEAESNLRLALSQQKLALKRDIDQQQQAYNQFKGATIGSLQEAIRSNSYQDYQLAMQDYNMLRQQEEALRQQRLDGLSYTTQTINQLFQGLTALAQQIENEDERDQVLAQLQVDLANELALAGADLSRYDEGLASGDLVAQITGRYDFASAPTGTIQEETTPTEGSALARAIVTSAERRAEDPGERFRVGTTGRIPTLFPLIR